MEQWTVVKYTGKSTANGLTNNKRYGVEIDPDLVEPIIYEEYGRLTIWDDKGHLNEISEGEYEVVSSTESDWWKVVPEQRYIEYL